MTKSAPPSRWGSYLIGAGVLVAVMGALLAVQDERHGWPFSRHHGMQADLPPQRLSPASTDTSTPAPRAPVAVEAARLEAAGVRFEPARMATMDDPVRGVATVVVDESRVSHVHTRAAGWVERLYVGTTGQSVRAGEPLAEVFSQELLSSQNEYLSALRRDGDGRTSTLVDAGRQRLEVLGMNAKEIAEIEQSGRARRLVTVTAPRSGTVLRRGVSVGAAVDPSTEIMTVADLSTVWVLAEVPDTATTRISVGTRAMLDFPSSGRDAFPAQVEFVYPTLTQRTRKAQVRFVVANADNALPPGLYGKTEFVVAAREALTVPRDAVVDTGETQHVFVRTDAGVLEPRTVKIGARVGERVEVLAGLSAGEPVVAAGVFLIDSESRLRASGVGGHAGHGPTPPAAPASETTDTATSHPGHGG